MSLTTYRHEASRLIVHYDTNLPQPTRFVIWLEGKGTTIVGKPGELPSAMWKRVVDRVHNMREGFSRAERMTPKQRYTAGMHIGSPHRFGNVYAGINPTQRQVQDHLRQWIVWALFKIADSKYSTAMQRVDALIALSELLGMVNPDLQRARHQEWTYSR